MDKDPITHLESSTILSWPPRVPSKHLSSLSTTPERRMPPPPRSKFSWTTVGSSSSSPGSTFTSPSRKYKIDMEEKVEEDSPRSIQIRSDTFQKWTFTKTKRKEPVSPSPRPHSGFQAQGLMISPKSQLNSSTVVKPNRLPVVSERQSIGSYFDFEDDSSSDGEDRHASFTFLKRRKRLNQQQHTKSSPSRLPAIISETSPKNTWMHYRDSRRNRMQSVSYTPELSRCSSASESLESLNSVHHVLPPIRDSISGGGGEGSLLPLLLKTKVDDRQSNGLDAEVDNSPHTIAPWLVHEEQSTNVHSVKPSHRRQTSEPITSPTNNAGQQPLLTYDRRRRPRLTQLSVSATASPGPTTMALPERPDPLTPNSLRALQNAIHAAKLAI